MMMPELSLHILDVVGNSISAKANLVIIEIDISQETDVLSIVIKDNGYGISPENLSKITDPFFTTRTTRNVGLGIPFFKQSAQSTGGTFEIKSIENKSTEIVATYRLSHIDRMPLGDMASTIHTLVVFNKDIDFLYTYKVNKKIFKLDTKDLRNILDGVPFDHPDIFIYLEGFLQESHSKVNEDNVF